ncbi:membrane-associated protein, putative [Bodo saltans]|uniref:Membrane-associated protein, putative n=1 Tax=Bodo saltans TaxID=75058 RepID=A0A0S4KI09_BODSA|nr:membrane-associated protein, putative [Bodo saltans]|eukprot:CUI15267.1 membrane-associated protein, putative [Bodo saltans]
MHAKAPRVSLSLKPFFFFFWFVSRGQAQHASEIFPRETLIPIHTPPPSVASLHHFLFMSCVLSGAMLQYVLPIFIHCVVRSRPGRIFFLSTANLRARTHTSKQLERRSF